MQTVGRPLAVRAGAKAAVEGDRGLVPVEHRPFEPTAAPSARRLREISEQALAGAEAPGPRPHVQILEVVSRLAEQRREVVEEEREPYGLVLETGEGDLGVGSGAEERRMQVR